MLFFSTNNISPEVNFREATIKGQASDKGLFFPEFIPILEKKFIDDINDYSKEEIAFKIIHPYIEDEIPKYELERIISETINFEFPLKKVQDHIYSLELYHGPTLAFKDVGARFMSRCLGYFVQNNTRKITVLVATSGDTGGAVANGFFDVDGVDVIILYPSGKVSSVQELQLTTLGKNIHALEVDGNFDDCQKMVKQAFADADLCEQMFLTSANSINVARWLPQQFYYFFAYQQWNDKQNPPVISVPSGNFGNICAGLLAHRSGLPVSHFIAACNVNDVVTNYLKTGIYESADPIATISNAMDVGNPSNFVRVLELFDKEFQSLQSVMSSYSFSDSQTKNIIKEVFDDQNYLLDPHGAIGYGALKAYLKEHIELSGMFLETAHPIKFFNVVEPLIQKKIAIPAVVNSLLQLKKYSIKIKSSYAEFKDYLLAR